MSSPTSDVSNTSLPPVSFLYTKGDIVEWRRSQYLNKNYRWLRRLIDLKSRKTDRDKAFGDRAIVVALPMLDWEEFQSRFPECASAPHTDDYWSTDYIILMENGLFVVNMYLFHKQTTRCNLLPTTTTNEKSFQ